jgi:rhodanese-related sulfurtransferase
MNQIHSQDVDDEHILVDVRTPGEFHSERIANSKNIPLDEFEEHIDSLAEHDNLVLVCASGNRAGKACQMMANRNLDAFVLKDGLKGWRNARRQVEKSQSGAISLERQVRIVAGTLAATGGLLALFVNPYWAAVPTFVGCGLVFAGVTDTCGMAMLLARLPYNRKSSS